jgi:hypothetical protein
LDAVEQALGLRLLVERSGTIEEFDFPHSLVRMAIHADIPRDELPDLHLRISEVLRRVPGRSPSEVATHLLAAEPSGSAANTAEHTRLAGAEAASRLAFDEAAMWYRRALDRATAAEWPQDMVASTGLDLARAMDASGQQEQAREEYLRAADVARRAAHPAVLADIAISATGPWVVAGRFRPVVLGLLDEALAAIGDDDLRRRVLLLVCQAAALYNVDPDRERRAADEAIELGRRLGDAESLAAGLIARRRWLSHRPLERARRLALSREVVGITTTGAGRALYLRACRLLLADLLESGASGEFDDLLDHYERVADELRSPEDVYWAMATRATQAGLRGDLVAAEQLARGALARGRDFQQPDADGVHLLQIFVLRFQQARLREVAGAIGVAADPERGHPAGYALAALTCSEAGDDAGAIRNIRVPFRSDGDGLPENYFWVGAIALFACAAATTRDPESVKMLSSRLRPFADHVVVFGTGGAVLGCGHHWLGMLAAAQGDIDRADEHLTAAIAVSDGLGAPYWVAQAEIDLALALCARGNRVERDRGEGLARSAVTTAQRYGFDRILARAALLPHHP